MKSHEPSAPSRDVILCVGGANFTPEDFGDFARVIGDRYEIVPLDQENDRLRYDNYSKYPDAPARWHDALLTQDRLEVMRLTHRENRRIAAIVGHCGGCFRALELIKDTRTQVGVLINPLAASIDKSKMEQLAFPREAPPMDYMERLLLNPLTQNADPDRLSRFFRRHLARLDLTPSAVDAAAAEGIFMKNARPDLRRRIEDFRMDSYAVLHTIEDPEDPWTISADIRSDKVMRNFFAGVGHYAHIFHPVRCAAVTLDAIRGITARQRKDGGYERISVQEALASK